MTEAGQRTDAYHTEGAALAPPTVISFAGVSKDFTVEGRTFQAVRDVDLRVREGEIVTLVGPSGCGKSTLLNMTAGLFEASLGEVTYRGIPVQGINTRVGYMTQNDHLLPWRTVAGNVALPIEIAGRPKAERQERVTELIDLVGLSGFEHSYPQQLSGGMRKRAALARLLAQNPETMLMDEPFGALDAQLRLILQIELRSLVKRLNKTVLFVTHDLDEAVAIADRCVVFKGRPGFIAEVMDVNLPPDRDLMKLRFDSDYHKQCAHLWSLIAPELEQGEHAND